MQRVKGISGSTLKIIAMISMLTDHTALVLFGGIMAAGLLTESQGYTVYGIMRRLIGRLAFPIFCFLLVEGFQKTGNRAKYAGRLFLFALISEIPFNLAFYGSIREAGYQNVFFTLGLGLIMMIGMEELKKRCRNQWLAFLGEAFLAFFTALLAQLIHCDYGAKGIAAIALLYFFRRNKTEQLLAGCIAFLWEVTAPLAFIPIAFYNGKRGLRMKYVFYVFYPAHLLLLYAVSRFFF